MVIIAVAIFGASNLTGKTFDAIATFIYERSTTRCTKTIFFAGNESGCSTSALTALVEQCIATKDAVAIEIAGCQACCSIDADATEIDVRGSPCIPCTIAGLRAGSAANA